MTNEEASLTRRIRIDIAAMVLTFFLQGAFLVNALRNGSTTGWVTWAVVAALAGIVIFFAGRRASRLSRRYRQLRWGDK